MDTFWDYVWYTILVFAFVAYLIILFQILADLFRDHTVSGIAKAAWVIALVIFPYITALVYLIARGKGMAVRSQHAHVQAKQAADDYIRPVAGKSAAEQIADAKALSAAGPVDAAEFGQLKRRPLGHHDAR